MYRLRFIDLGIVSVLLLYKFGLVFYLCTPQFLYLKNNMISSVFFLSYSTCSFSIYSLVLFAKEEWGLPNVPSTVQDAGKSLPAGGLTV